MRCRAAILTAVIAGLGAPEPTSVRDVEEIAGRVVVAGIPGAGAVASVGAFHAGGPIHDRPAFHVLTEPGMVLDPGRILVASTSNVGAPLAPNGQPPGSILSIDARGGSTIVVAPDFATAGGQAAADDGRVVLLTANSPEFLNRVYNPGAVTAHLASVAVPMAISINNAFGRIWFANMPGGIARDGYESIVDPDGRPLNGAPSTIAGGIFSGASTNREPQLLRGAMSTGAVATALLGRSPDGSGRAVFAVLNADGSLVQIHVEKGVDGLSPPGTVTLASGSRRAGMVFNWVPDPILYVTDAGANAIVALTLRRDGHVFRTQSMRSITAAAFDEPVDLAPAIAEIASDEFSSNTTLAGDADLYVVNRGSGTVARVKQSGTVVAVRRVTLPQVGVLGAHRLNGIAVSPDARFLWLTITGRLPGLPEGAVIEIPAFGAPEIEEGTLRDRGAVVFARTLTPAEGLGPLFNRESCVACHEYGGMGPGGLGTATRVGRLTARGFDPMIGEGGPIARARSVGDAGAPCDLSAGIPSGVNVISVRNAPDLRGTGTIDAIPDEEIVAGAVPRGDDVHGRVHRVRGADGRERVGRFGWKAETATLLQFVADAFRNELGITSPLAPTDILPAGRPGRLSCAGESDRVEDDGSMVYAVTAFLRSLPPHQPRHSGLQGAALFNATGCSACHTPSLAVGGRRAWLYSDLLLHDVGPTLDDKVVQGDARGRDWRTTPLWGLGHRARLLHDGRARTITEAIDAHGGEAEAARARFQALSAGQRRALLAFLGGL